MKDYIKFVKHPSLILWNVWTRIARFIKSDELYLKIYYRLRTGKSLDLNNPKSFTEKIQWLKIYHNRTPECSVMVDKYAAKQYVADRIGEEHIIPTYGVWNKFDDINIDNLPNQFVLKTTHSSGGIYICKDKSHFNRELAKKKLENNLKRDIVYRSREYQYGGVEPRIIAEKYMEDETGELKDYKFFCFNGKPEVLFYASDRYTPGKGGVKFDYYDMDYKLLPITSQGHGHSDIPLIKSRPIEEMKVLAAKLSKGYPFLRVDFYCIQGKIYFGELTFHHDGGIVPFEPEEWDYKLGDLIELPEKKHFKFKQNQKNKMKRLLFISIDMPNLESEQGGYYADILSYLANKRLFDITILAPSLADSFTGYRKEGNINVIRVSTGDFIGNIPLWKKGFRIISMSRKYKKAYTKYINVQHFDIVMMGTPPSSLYDVIKLVKKKSDAKFYLLLRDIHPECLDRKKTPEKFAVRTDVYEECKRPYGVNIFVEKLIYHQSQSLYKLADRIGCMSPGNMTYFKSIAPYIKNEQVVLLPNWYKGKEYCSNYNDDLREKYDLKNKFIAIFGGTIGEAQAIWNIATLAKHNLTKKEVVFLIVGRGSKKAVLEEMARKDNLTNMRFMNYMPREDYERILELADVGLISIDEKYKVPTCPSKIIGYMALAKPVIAMFNKGNDFGNYYIDNSGCGLYSTDLDHQKMFDNFDWLYYHPEERKAMGMSGYHYYKTNLTVDAICDTLEKQISEII